MKGHTIIPGRFVDEIKQIGTPMAKYKSRFVAQAYNDKFHSLQTYAPMVLRVSIRIALSFSACDSCLTVFGYRRTFDGR